MRSRSLSRSHRQKSLPLVLAGALAAAILAAPGSVLAGQCPPGKQGSNPLKDAPTKPVGVTDEVLSHIELSKQKVKLAGHKFRLRRLTIEPGGIVPFHMHDERPALIYIISGTIEEHSSQCTVPIVHKAGEAARESVGLSHWWKNTGSEPVVLTSADIVEDMMKGRKM